MRIKKKVISVITVMMVISMISTVVIAAICEKDCGTKVEQCDVETVLTMQDMDEGQRICIGPDNSVYLDMDPSTNKVSEGDVRLTTTCEPFLPNTKVIECDCDAGNDFIRTLNSDADVFMYIDMNENGYYDLADPVYLSMDEDDEPSSGDIRLTDSPAYDVLDPASGELMISAGSYGNAWSRLNINSDEMDMGYDEIGDDIDDVDASVEDLCYWVDGDCSGTWTCSDKIYLQQPHENSAYEREFDHVVTIGDVRLYMPPDENVYGSDECLPDCGTKVDQCSLDAVYALMLFDPDDEDSPTWGYYDTVTDGIADLRPHQEAVYIDMDNSNDVTPGDIRLTYSCSETYPPNSKVKDCDIDAMNTHPLTTPDSFGDDAQTHVFKFADIDGVNGYSLGDPLYMDMDNSSDVSLYDIRITQSPLNDLWWPAGSFGPKWSIVQGNANDILWNIQLQLLPGGRNTLSPPSIAEVLGYVDTDCSRSWTCVDKLYLQQLRPESHFDSFVTVGDVRLYIPPEMVGSGPDEPCWLECGTKVEKCDVDNTYVLIRNIDHDWPIDGKDIDVKYSDDGNGIYLDMDDDDYVSNGDIRLVETCNTNPPNTKVGSDCINDPDLDENLVGWDDDDEPVVIYADLNGNGRYDLTDPIYLHFESDEWRLGIDSGDIRLSGCPIYDNDNYGLSNSIGEPWSIVESSDIDATWSSSSTSTVDIEYITGSRSSSELDKLISIMDSDCSGTWTCPDMLYIQQPNADDIRHNQHFVTIGDHRLYVPLADSPPVPVCKGNFDTDSEINWDDFVAFGAAYGSSLGDANYHPAGDFNDDEIINWDDFVAFGAVYGTSC